MTTLAYKDGVLAADMLSCNSSGRRGAFDKVVTHNGVIYAGCGAINQVLEFFEWASLNEPKDFKLTKLEDFAGLILRFPDGRPELWTVEEALRPWRVKMPYTARGSGCEYAIGAMSMGAPALKAVEIATIFDTNSGPPIQVCYRNEAGEIVIETRG